MIEQKTSSAFVIGLALFSMFFGAGNLIFPMTVGKHAEGMYLYGTLGFLITAVLLPFAGVFMMVLFKGDYVKFFGILGKPLGFLFALFLLTFWIPMGSAPRCITLAYSAVKTYAPSMPLWLFSGVYSAIIFLLTFRENRIIGILGRVLTPLLLLSLAAIIGVGLYYNDGLNEVNLQPHAVFFNALIEGYHTQDLIASFFFSSAIIHILTHPDATHSHVTTRSELGLMLRSGAIGIAILAVVYLGLLYLGAAYADVLQETSKDSLLSQLAVVLLGVQGAFIPVVTIALACVSTSVALMLVFTNFLRENVCQERISQTVALAITVLVTFGMSLMGFEGISHILGGAMYFLYPALIVIMIANICLLAIRHLKHGSAVNQK
jgi:LIVCS family branched-chain amino acid:cation transporter